MKSTQGSALITVVISVTVAGIAAASVLSLMTTQRKLALRKELEMHAVNAAESAIDYGYSILINKVGTAGNFSISEIPAAGSIKQLTLTSSGSDFLSGNIAMPTNGYTGSTGNVVLKDASIKVMPVATSSNRRYIDPADPANDDDPNRGMWVWDTEVPLVAKVTAAQGNDAYSAYLRKSIVGRRVPMFQHAIFFQGQLQLHRGYRVVGPVHTNGTMLLNAHNDDTSIYAGGLTSSGHFYRGSTIDEGGAGADPYGYTPVDINGDLDFSTSISPRVQPAATGNNRISIYVETQERYGSPVYVTKYNNSGFDSRMAEWRDKALQAYKGNLQDKAHQVPTFTPQGSIMYRQDVVTTAAVNEFSNGTYSLIEPLLPSSHASVKTDTSRANKLAANAGLILRIERNNEFIPKDSSGTAYPSRLLFPGAGAYAYNFPGIPRYYYRMVSGSRVYFNTDNEWIADNRNERFVVKGYKYTTRPASGVTPVLAPVRLPDRLIGTANAAISAVQSGMPYAETTKYSGTSTTSLVTQGLHDARLGRAVEPFTLDMRRFKRVLEGTDTDATALDFIADFSPTADWNGVVYIEMPTSLTPNTGVTPNTTETAGLAISSQPYLYGPAELRHPDRWSETDNLGRMNRTDHIVPIAPELRRYPSNANNATIQSAEFAIPAVQVINALALPDPTGSPGLTLATNMPLYLVGSYNSDANIETNTNYASASPTGYSTRDPGEVPASIFCDTLTVLSDQWASGNRARGFNGSSNGSTTRMVNSRLEIASSVATGEYPVFEFFTHALESYQNIYSATKPPIVFKGSVMGMFKSEIQHIKKAYGRNQSSQIEDYWNAHGSYAIPSIRFHKDLVDGTFPPGIPMSIIFRPSDHRFLRPGNTADAAIISAAGF